MANVPAGGVRKKLTLQTKKRYHISSPTIGKLPNSSGRSELFTKCDNSSRKKLFSLCIPKSSLVSPLPVSKLQFVREVKADETHLPPPNFELLTHQSLSPLDLKKHQPHSEQKVEVFVAKTTAHQTISTTTSMHHVGGTVSCDFHGEGRYTNFAGWQQTPHHMVQKTVGVAIAMCSSHVTQPQRYGVKVGAPSVTIHSNNQSSNMYMSFAKDRTDASHKTILDKQISSSSSELTKTGQGSRVSVCGGNGPKQQEKHSCKRTWDETNDNDEEFDELCQMVDLSFDTLDAAATERVTMAMTTPDSSWNDSHHICHTNGSARKAWTCPMCNEQFEGRSAEEYECEQHLVQCLAMDVA